MSEDSQASLKPAIPNEGNLEYWIGKRKLWTWIATISLIIVVRCAFMFRDLMNMKKRMEPQEFSEFVGIAVTGPAFVTIGFLTLLCISFSRLLAAIRMVNKLRKTPSP